MKTKHTEGELKVGRGGRLECGGRVIADMTHDDAGKAAANAERIALAWNLLADIPNLLPDPQKLKLLALHFDMQDRFLGNKGTEVQDDLRKWADNIESILAKAANPNAGIQQPFPKGRYT